MKHLLRKEILEARRFAWALSVTFAALLALREPLLFRQDPFSTGSWVFAPMFVAFLMGLSAYSRETAGGTLPFLLSRPVGAWRLLAAKLIAGLLLCAAAVLFSALFYLVTMPGPYRPHAGAAFIGEAVLDAGLVVGIGYLAGFAASSLASGLALSLVIGIVLLVGIILTGEEIARIHANDAVAVVLVIGIAVAFLASVAPRVVLSQRRRVARWLSVVGAALALAAALAGFYHATGADPRPPYDSTELPSPDRTRTAYFPSGGTDGGSVWVEPAEGHFLQVDRAQRIAEVGWMPDSRRFLYVADAGGRILLKQAAAETAWHAHTVSPLPDLGRDGSGVPLYFQFMGFNPRAWSPSGQRLAFGVDDGLGKPGCTVLAVEPRTGQMRVLRIREGAPRFWWADDRTLLVLLPEQTVRSLRF